MGDTSTANYAARYPVGGAAVDERVRAFVSSFYAISDDASRDGEWVGCFAPGASLVMGERRATGVDEIRELRRGMWEKVKSRRHKVDKVFPGAFGRAADGTEGGFEYMLHGSVDMELKCGGKSTAQWAGHAVLTDGEGGLKYALYQVYIHFLPA